MTCKFPGADKMLWMAPITFYNPLYGTKRSETVDSKRLLYSAYALRDYVSMVGIKPRDASLEWQFGWMERMGGMLSKPGNTPNWLWITIKGRVSFEVYGD